MPTTTWLPALCWIPALPLASFALLILFGRRIGKFSGWLAVTALAAACGATLAMADPVFHGARLSVR